MNKFIRVATLTAIATYAGGSLATAEVQKRVKPTASGDLNVRSGPGRGFPQLLVLPMGTPVNIVEVSPDRKWSRGVFSDGGTGWMRNRYLQADEQSGGGQSQQL